MKTTLREAFERIRITPSMNSKLALRVTERMKAQDERIANARKRRQQKS